MEDGFNGAYNYASGRPYYNIRYDGSKYYFADMGETIFIISVFLTICPRSENQMPKALLCTHCR
jgi:hypothetical protein